MAADLGLLCLALALGFSVAVCWCSAWGGYRNNAILMRNSVRMFLWSTVWVVLSFAALCISFLRSDYSVALVARHSHELMPTFYKFSAVWGNHEGSFLLWILILTLWGMFLCLSKLPLDYKSRAIGVLALLLVAFLGFSIFTSNPFERLLPIPPRTGEGLNPLLQDPAMIVHPPLLYMGYVGFAVPFAFAMAYLLAPSERRDVPWVEWVRPWALAAWAFLSAGIALGSWWAYYELGWGGFWFWDPVENASFMPWLLATALIHSLRLAIRDKAFYLWSIMLAISCFALSLLGTFLVRSGVLVSVHSFAADPARGVYLLSFFMLVVAGALTIVRWRKEWVQEYPDANSASGSNMRAYTLVVNNYLLSLSTAIVLVGTLFPLFAHALRDEIWSVGPPYFNAVLTPIFLLLILLMAEAPNYAGSAKNLLQYRHIAVQVLSSLTLAFVVYQLLAYTVGIYPSWWVVPILALVVRLAWHSVRIVNKGQVGAGLGHLGLAVCALGIVASTYFGDVRDVRLTPGEQATVGNVEFQLVREMQRNGVNYQDQTLVLKAAGQHIEAAKRHYTNRNQVLSEAGIINFFGYDLYVVPGERAADGSWSMRIQVKPLVRLIWLGGFIMMFGALLVVGRAVFAPSRAVAANA